MAYGFNRPKGGFLRHDGDIDLMVKTVEVDPKQGEPINVKVTLTDIKGDILTNKYDLTNRGAQFAFLGLLEGVYPDMDPDNIEWDPTTMVGKYINVTTILVQSEKNPENVFCNIKKVNGPAAPFPDPEAPVGTSLL